MSIEIEIDHARVLFNFYNTISGKRVRRNEKNLKLIEECLELNNQDESDIKDYMKWYCLYKNDQDLKPDFEECMREYVDYYNLSFDAKEPIEEIVPEEQIRKESTALDKADPQVLMEEEQQEALEDKTMTVPQISKKVNNPANSVKSEKNPNERYSFQTGNKEVNQVLEPVLDKEIGENKNLKSDKEKDQPTLPGTLSDSFGLLGASMAGMIQDIITDALNKQYLSMLDETKKEVLSYVEEKCGPNVQTIKLEFDDGRLNPIEDEVIHEKLPEILNFVVADEPVFLVGPTGCGKNHVCKQVAKIMELPFYFSNAITQEYKLVGFTDANGTYQETQFYKAFKDGGIFMLDEIDASLPDALIILNAAISNRYFDFPAPIGFVEAHPDFRVIAAGNTWGNGADLQYVGRNQLDMASLDRFAVVNMDYSEQVEAALCPDHELQTFLREYRNAVNKNGLMSSVSYRAFRRMYLLESRYEKLHECLDSCLCKGLCRDDLLMIHKQIKTANKYKEALKVLAESRSEKYD